MRMTCDLCVLCTKQQRFILRFYYLLLLEILSLPVNQPSSTNAPFVLILRLAHRPRCCELLLLLLLLLYSNLLLQKRELVCISQMLLSLQYLYKRLDVVHKNTNS